MAYVDRKQGKKEGEWFLDSGCNNHMSGNMEWFLEMDESFRHIVKLGNNTRMVVMGKRNVRLNVNGVTH
ncbi:Retrovirus-related Pol polyprotein from transposon TNT 1-94, partial [Sesbania bispinosa]